MADAMKALHKRLEALEHNAGGSVNWSVVLDRLTDSQLDQLEGIVARLQDGAKIEELSTDDLRVIASMQIVDSEMALGLIAERSNA